MIPAVAAHREPTNTLSATHAHRANRQYEIRAEIATEQQKNLNDDL